MTANAVLTTQQVADRLGVAFWYLGQLLRERAIPHPARLGHSFAWTEADVQRAATVIAERRARRQQHSIAAAKG